MPSTPIQQQTISQLFYEAIPMGLFLALGKYFLRAPSARDVMPCDGCTAYARGQISNIPEKS